MYEQLMNFHCLPVSCILLSIELSLGSRGSANVTDLSLFRHNFRSLDRFKSCAGPLPQIRRLHWWPE